MSCLHLNVMRLGRWQSAFTVSTDSMSKKNMMIMKKSELQSALQTGIHALQRRICCSRGVPGPILYIHNESQLVKAGFIQIQEPHSGLDGRSQLCQNITQQPGNTRQQKLQRRHEYLCHVTVSYTLRCRSEMCPKINNMPATAATLLRMSQPMSHILTEVASIA